MTNVDYQSLKTTMETAIGHTSGYQINELFDTYLMNIATYGPHQIFHLRQQLKDLIDSGCAEQQGFLPLCMRQLTLIDLAWAGTKVRYRHLKTNLDIAGAELLYMSAITYARHLYRLEPFHLDNLRIVRIAKGIEDALILQTSLEERIKPATTRRFI